MKIVVSGRAVAFDNAARQEITQSEELKKLDGIVYAEDSCCEYLTAELEKIGLTGGLLRLAYVEESGQLRVMTEYVSPRELKPGELRALIQNTTAQWSDGIGESYYWQQVRPGVSVDLSPPAQDVRTEQIDDGLKPLEKGLSPQPLLKAVETGNVEKIKKLLARGGDLNAIDKQGRPALQVAIWKKQIDAALLLIERGANVDARAVSNLDSIGQTALHVLCRGRVPSVEVVQALLQRGADANARDSRGWTPLMWAAASGQLEVAKLLIERGADVNVRDTDEHNEGHTALMHTVNLQIIELLLRHGADPNIRNDRGQTSYEAALFQAGQSVRGARERWMPAAQMLLAAIRSQADAGDAMSQHSLADFHDRGVGSIKKDEKEAFRGLEQSARNGCRISVAGLGLCHLGGKGTTVDVGKAIECLKNAAKMGVPLAMGVLGECSEKGQGVPKDLQEAVDCYRRGAEIDPATDAQPAEIYHFRNGAGACRAELGECYEQGKGVAKDLRKALHWYQAASQVGFYHVAPAIQRVEEALRREHYGTS